MLKGGENELGARQLAEDPDKLRMRNVPAAVQRKPVGRRGPIGQASAQGCRDRVEIGAGIVQSVAAPAQLVFDRRELGSRQERPPVMEAVPVGYCDRPWNIADNPVGDLAGAIAPTGLSAIFEMAETRAVRLFEAC